MQDEGEPITVNAIIPGLVATGILDAALVNSIPAQHRTPVSVIVQAIENIINDSSITGQAIECSGTEIVARPPAPYINEAARYIMQGEYKKTLGDDAVLKFSLSEKDANPKI